MTSLKFITDRSKVDDNGCWLWQKSIKNSGYGQLKKGNRAYRAHRYAWELANGPIPENMHVCHKCDVRHCVNPDHLFLGTNQDNVDDRQAKKRNKPRYGKRGEEGIDWEVVEKIRNLQGIKTAKELADKFKIHRGTVYRIWNKQRRAFK